MLYFRRFIWFIAKYMVLICVLLGMLVCGFFMAMNVSNIYVVLNDGMEKRVDVILTRQQAEELNKYFHADFLIQDTALEGAINGDSVYTNYNITGFDYSLTIEKGTPFYEVYGTGTDNPPQEARIFPLPDEETERRMQEIALKRAETAGLHRYEISNYALEGCECRHNLGYWTGTEYLGLGLGAASLLEGKRFSNLRNIEEYINKDSKVDTATVEHLSQKDLMAEFMILGLRLTEGVSAVEFEQRFGSSVDAVYGPVLKKYCELGLLKTGERIALTKKGLDLSNTVMCEFLPD